MGTLFNWHIIYIFVFILLKQRIYGTDADVLNSIYGDNQPIPVIFQSGYLTIKGYDKEFKFYRLGFPNREVEEGFLKFLVE